MRRLRPSGALVVGLVVTSIVGFLLAGIGGAVVAVTAGVIAAYEPRLVALYALVALVGMAALTMFEAPLDATLPMSSFVGERPAAALVGRIAGIVFLVAVAALWARESATSRRHVSQEPAVSWRSPAAEWRRRLVPVTLGCAVAAIVLNTAGDRSLRAATIPLAGVAVLAAALAWREARAGGASVTVPSTPDQRSP